MFIQDKVQFTAGIKDGKTREGKMNLMKKSRLYLPNLDSRKSTLEISPGYFVHCPYMYEIVRGKRLNPGSERVYEILRVNE